MILDINILGKKIIYVNLYILFFNSFKLNGPEPIASNIEYKLPNGEIRKFHVKLQVQNCF